MQYIKVDDYESLLKEPELIQSHIIDFTIFMREKRGLAPNSIKSHLAGVKRFYDMNDITLNWKKIWMYQGEFYQVVDDEAYTVDQIKLLVDNADMRDKAIILLMASTGMRGGAVPKLKLKDLKPIDNLYKIRVYKKTHEQYHAFCTPEARHAIDDYLAYRKRATERLEDNTPLFRQRFNPEKDETIVRPIGFSSIASIIFQLLNKTGVRPKIPRTEGQQNKRTSLPMIHGFRKFAITAMIRAGVEFGAREQLVGHKTGLDSHYDRRNEGEILAEYSKAIPLLTIDPKNRLEREVKTLKEENTQIQKYLAKIDNLYEKLGIERNTAPKKTPGNKR